MLVGALLETYRRSPDKVAVADPTRELSFRRLAVLASVVKGIVSRETSCARIGIMLPASAVFPAVFMGVSWALRTVIPLNFLLSPGELSRIVENAALDLIITVRHFEQLATRLGPRVLVLEDLNLKRRLLLRMVLPLPPAPRVDADETAVILYTSGTSSEPKGVELTQSNLHSNCVDTIHSLNMDENQKFLNVLPPFHVFGLTANVLVPIVLGASVFAIPRFSPAAVVRAVRSQRISVLLAIPSMYAAILKLKSARSDSFRDVRLAVSGGEPLPESVRIGFKERFGVVLREGYGLTETSPVVTACPADADRAGSVGKPIRNVEIRIVGAEGQPLAPGEAGEILVRGPGVMKGYFRNREETRRVLDRDGWFRTGDIGSFDADGFLSLTGQCKEMLIIGGENVFPREIEAVLEEHE
ncbi:MAG: class I adenylate-forming enzyme family protein, partial [Phycisphaerae bacterium]